jgi:hypothetical protein
MDPQHRDARTRRRIRWTVIILVIVALGLYVGTFVRQLP